MPHEENWKYAEKVNGNKNQTVMDVYDNYYGRYADPRKFATQPSMAPSPMYCGQPFKVGNPY